MSCNGDSVYDRHHIIPRYDGGADDFTNIIKITRTQHIMYHFANFQRLGNNEDYVAYRGLAGMMSKKEILQARARMAGQYVYENKLGLHAMTKEEHAANSSKGGKKVGKYMSNSMWVNNGIENKRILKTSPIPEGYVAGKAKKLSAWPRKHKTREEYLADKRKDYEWRREYLDKIEDLNKYGIRTAIAKDWGVSRTQVNRFIAQHYNKNKI